MLQVAATMASESGRSSESRMRRYVRLVPRRPDFETRNVAAVRGGDSELHRYDGTGPAHRRLFQYPGRLRPWANARTRISSARTRKFLASLRLEPNAPHPSILLSASSRTVAQATGSVSPF